jgi:CBS domain-containing protein
LIGHNPFLQITQWRKIMFGLKVRDVMEQNKLLTALTATSVRAAARQMADRKVGAVLVVEHEKLLGIFTERDMVIRVVARGLDPETTPLAEVMTAEPHVVDPDKSFGYALLLMHEHGFRHMPVVERGSLIGIVSARHALDPEMEEFVAEAHRREQILRERG